MQHGYVARSNTALVKRQVLGLQHGARPSRVCSAFNAAGGARTHDLGVGPEEVVQFVEAGDGWPAAEGAVWSAAIVEVQPAGESGVALALER